jgi:pyruvate/2-oxoglutarate dehydrogenase complex dihydrolipoamide dehydrogenase (E3) component
VIPAPWTEEKGVTTMTKTTDVAIIGFGKAGKTLAVKLASAGKSVILMEENPKRYGGTCINVACIPTKTLTEKALLSAKIGGSWNGRKTFFANAVSAKDKLIAVLRDKNYHKLADNPAIQVIDGHASFIDNTHLKVNDDCDRSQDDCHQHRFESLRASDSGS